MSTINKLNVQYDTLALMVNEIKSNQDKTSLETIMRSLKELLEQLNFISNQLIPSRRQPRGAFNFLGTIIKAVSGNLDADDAAKYEKLIENLDVNQQELTKDVQAQIHVSQQNYPGKSTRGSPTIKYHQEIHNGARRQAVKL